MGFLGRRGTQPAASSPAPSKATTRARGEQAESQALAFLQSAGLQLLERNYRVPVRGGGEIDLILRDEQGCLVFVEVRSRFSQQWGGAGASIGVTKQARIIGAARYYLLQWAVCPPCRFDVVLFDGGQCQWIQGAFSAQG